MSWNEILRNQRWRLGIILHAEEVTHNVAKSFFHACILLYLKKLHFLTVKDQLN